MVPYVVNRKLSIHRPGGAIRLCSSNGFKRPDNTATKMFCMHRQRDKVTSTFWRRDVRHHVGSAALVMGLLTNVIAVTVEMFSAHL